MGRATLRKSEQVYWIKAGAAIINGGLCFCLNGYLGLNEYITVMAGLTLYMALSEGLAVITKIERDRTLKIGIGAFIFLWMIVWTLLNTLAVLG